MEFLYQHSHNGKNKVIVMQHGEETLEWHIEKYRSFVSDELVFGDINTILGKLSEEAQKTIFECYQDIHRAVVSVPVLAKLDRIIKNNFRKIEECLPYQNAVNWANQSAFFWIPPDPKKQQPKIEVNLSSFSDPDRPDEAIIGDDEATDVDNIDRDNLTLTYTRRDIIDLNILLVYSKLYLPVLSEYNILIKDDVPLLFQQMKTIDLISHLDFTKEQGWKRLDAYVDLFWQGHKRKMELNPSILLKGLSLDGVVDWLLAELVFKILLPTGVSHTHQRIPDSDRPNFIGRLFHTLDSYAGSITKNTKAEYYMDKGTPPNESPGDDRASKLESCRVVSEFREADIQQNNVFCENMEFLLPHVDKTLPREALDDIGYSIAYHRSKNVLRDTLIKWVCHRIIVPKMVSYINDAAYGNLFKLTYALLNHWGFEDLADLIDSRIDYSIDRSMAFNNIDITAEQVKKLKEYYPHEVEQNRVKGEGKRNSSYVILSCYMLHDDIKGYTMTSYHKQMTYTCTYDVQYRLAELIIFMNQHQHI